MSWRERDTLGRQAIGEVHDLLDVPYEWLIDMPEGFSWWPGELSQRVWTDEGIFRNSRTFYRLHCETDMFRGKGMREQLELLLEDEMDDCMFSCLVYDKSADVFRLHSSVYAEAEIAHWVCKLFYAAVSTQIYRAYRIVDRISETLHPSIAVSEHPNKGARKGRHVLIKDSILPIMVKARDESLWRGLDEWRHVDYVMERLSLAFAKSDGSCSHSTFGWAPDPEQTIKLRVSCDEPHAEFGNGVRFTLTVPLKLSGKHVAYLALELNEHERANWLKTHLLGSWGNHNGSLAFRLFIPNQLYQEGVMEELSVTMATRAIWVSEFFERKKAEAEQAKGGATLR